MKQIVKNTKTIKKKPKQPKKKKISNDTTSKRLPKKSNPTKKKRSHPKFGTSKLEMDFAKDFLDKLGIEYVWQFEAREIGRFFDYFLPKSRVLIEVDGDYYHSYGLVNEDMSPMQKKNQRVDEDKNRWAALHGIPLIRIWEHDIKNNPSKVMRLLKEKIHFRDEVIKKKEEKSKRHVNRINKKIQ